MCYFMLDSTAGQWATDATPIDNGTVTWNREFTNIKCRDPESDRLEFYVVDGAHWKPDRQNKDGINSNPPDQHLYGLYKASVIQFERGKTEEQTLVLQNKSKQDTTFSFTMQGRFLDSNIDDARLEGQAAAAPPAAAPGPPPAGMPPVAAPVAAGGWDGVSWPPNGYPQVATAPCPQHIGPPQAIAPGTHVGLSIGNGGDEEQGSDVGDKSGAGMITVLSSCKIHWTSLHGRCVLVNCMCTNVDPEPGSDIHVYGGSFGVGDNKGGMVTHH